MHSPGAGAARAKVPARGTRIAGAVSRQNLGGLKVRPGLQVHRRGYRDGIFSPLPARAYRAGSDRQSFQVRAVTKPWRARGACHARQ
jgi:hypothetical protein